MIDISAGLSSATYIFNVLRGASRLAKEHEVRVAIDDALDRVSSVQGALIDAQTKLSAQQDEIRALKDELHTHETWGATASQYQLQQAPGSAIVYFFASNPAHYACPVCFSARTISPLQPLYSGNAKCPKCEAVYSIQPADNRPLTFTSEWSRD